MLKYASIPKSVTLHLKIEPFSILEKQREENGSVVDCKTDLQYVTHSALKKCEQFLATHVTYPYIIDCVKHPLGLFVISLIRTNN